MPEPHDREAAATLPVLLDDLTVLDLAGESGLYCGKLLADLGARVIRVEPPGGDPLRQRPPSAKNGESLFYLHFNTNKRSVTLDITRPAGAHLFRRLAKSADVVLETFAPGHLAGLGLGFADLVRVNPSIILASITPFGQHGPYSGFSGADIVASAMGGMMWLSGFPEDPPNVPGAEQAYHYASTIAAAGILVALNDWQQDSGSRGAHLDISIEECVAMSTLQSANANYWTWLGQVPGRNGGGGPDGRSIHKCRDGWVSMVVPPYFWDSLLAWLQEEGLAGALDETMLRDARSRQPHLAEIARAIDALCARHTRREIMEQGQARRLLCVPVNGVDDLLRDPQLESRGFFLTVPAEGGTRVYPGHPYQFTGAPEAPFEQAADAGASNEEVFVSGLGLANAELAALHAEGVI